MSVVATKLDLIHLSIGRQLSTDKIIIIIIIWRWILLPSDTVKTHYVDGFRLINRVLRVLLVY